MSIKDLAIGQKINSWTVIEYDKLRSEPKRGKRGRKYWICQCDCGSIKSVRENGLTAGTSSQCFQCSAKNRNKHNHNVFNNHYRGAKHRASENCLNFNITIEYIQLLLEKQNYKCALSGVDIIVKYYRQGETTASLDRIDSSKGYEVGNVQWVHKNVNSMKNNMSEEKFIMYCDLISKKHSMDNLYVN